MSKKTISYRPEIDGLRAIAVISVVFYHAELNLFDQHLFKGGFLGVDIFFVISGFLITSIILKENEHNNFSLSNFYQRRFRRIIPALVTVLSISLIFGLLILLPDQLIELTKSLTSSFFFVSNYFFYLIGQNYLATNSFYIPFLHTWSLSIEEQFYIFFPIIFLLVNKFFNFKYFLIFLFLTSLIFCHYFSNINPSLNFYLIFSRIWELIAGGILAYHSKRVSSSDVLQNNLLSILGLVLIIFSIFFGSHNINHPSFITLIPVMGSFLIVGYSGNSNNFTRKILSNKIFIFIGKISFSLYLWHYPVFAYARITDNFNVSFAGNLLIYILLIFLSILTFNYVEKPFRNTALVSFKKTFLIFFGTIIMFSLFSIYIIKNVGLPKRFSKNIISYIEQEHPYNLIKKNNDFCHNNSCTFNYKYKKEIFLLGDSTIATLQKPIYDFAKKNKYRFTTLTNDGCSYVAGFIKISRKTNEISGCTDQQFQKKRKLILSNKESYVIIGQRMPLYLSYRYFDNLEGGVEGGEWPMYLLEKGNSNNNKKLNKKKYKKNFKNSLNEILKNGNKILLVYPIPEVGWNPKRRLLNMSFFIKSRIDELLKENFISTSYDVYLKRTKETFELYDSIKHKNLIRVYPDKLFCNTKKLNRCIINEDNIIYYYDDDHLSLDGSKKLFDRIINEIN